MTLATKSLTALAAIIAVCAAAGSAGAQSDTDYAVVGRTITKVPEAAALVPPALNGTIRAVTAATNKPWTYLNEKNELVGIEIDVAKSIAAKLGVKITFENIKFEGVIPSLQANKADMIAAGMGDSEKREEILNFINYTTLGLVIFTRENEKTINGIVDLCGKSVSRINGDVFGPWLEEKVQPKCDKEGKGKVNIRTFPDHAAAVLSVRSQSADAQITGLVSATGMINAPGNQGLYRIIRPANSPRGWKLANGGFGVLKGNLALTRAIEAAMKSAESEGLLQAIADHHGYPQVIIDKVVVNKPVPDGNLGGID